MKDIKNITVVVTAVSIIKRARIKEEDPANEHSYSDYSSALDEVVSEIRREIENLRDLVEYEIGGFVEGQDVDWDGLLEEMEDS